MIEQTKSIDTSAVRPLIFFLQTLMTQALGFAIAVIGESYIHGGAWWIVGGAAVAWGISVWLQMSAPWQFINLLILPGAATTILLSPPAWLLPAAFLTALLIYGPAFWTRVPYYPTSEKSYEKLLSLLPTDIPFTFVDLGCGFGELLVYLSKNAPHGSYRGVEIGAFPYLLSKIRGLFFGNGRVSVRFQSIWDVDLSKFDVVYAFLSPAPMERLWEKVKAEMHPGAIFISNSFAAPYPCDQVIEVFDKRACKLMIYRR